MTMTFKQVNLAVDLKLGLAEGQELRPVRCLDLRTGQARGWLANLLEGYDHMGGNWDENEDVGYDGESIWARRAW